MPYPGETQRNGGQVRVWQPDSTNVERFKYQGENSGFSSVEDAAAADEATGQGSWVPATDKPDGMPWWMKTFIATGLGSAAVTGLGALAAPGAFGGAAGGGAAVTPAAAGAAAAAPGASVVGAAPGLTGGAMGGVTFGTPAAAGGGFAGGAVPGATFAPTAAGGGAGGGGLFSSILSGVQKAAPILSSVGQAIGGADKAAANNRGGENTFNQENARLQAVANQTGVSAFSANNAAQSALEQELMNRAIQEGAQRKNAYSDVYKESVAENPSQSPFDTKGAPALSQRFLDTVHGLAAQGQTMLKAPLVNNVAGLPKLAPVQPYVPTPLTLPVWKKPGTLETVGNWLGPGLTLAGSLLK